MAKPFVVMLAGFGLERFLAAKKRDWRLTIIFIFQIGMFCFLIFLNLNRELLKTLLNEIAVGGSAARLDLSNPKACVELIDSVLPFHIAAVGLFELPKKVNEVGVGGAAISAYV